ncbi:MAG: outer membrane lipoprotein carrier protein LolA [Sphingobium sp.]|nr:outer membrane lipoprotein carrier protein LolA [Sphingobium sp.]
MSLFSFVRALVAVAALSLPAIGFVPGLAVSAHAQSGQGDLAAVNKAIRSITTLKAAFTQTDAKGQIQTGTVLLKQPGHVRFNYAGGDLLIVADGKSLYMVDYEVAQVQRLPIRNSPIGALLDPSRDLTRYGKLVPSGRNDVISVEARDSAHPEYGVITLVFARKASAPGGLELSGWVMKDAQGSRTTISLSGITYGGAIADSAFGWRDPRPNQTGPRH